MEESGYEVRNMRLRTSSLIFEYDDSTTIGREENKKLNNLLQALLDNNDSELFRNPVDVKGNPQRR